MGFNGISLSSLSASSIKAQTLDSHPYKDGKAITPLSLTVTKDTSGRFVFNVPSYSIVFIEGNY